MRRLVLLMLTAALASAHEPFVDDRLGGLLWFVVIVVVVVLLTVAGASLFDALDGGVPCSPPQDVAQVRIIVENNRNQRH